MDIFFYTCLFIFWTLFWSFSSVIIYRIKSWEGWILNWRSHCSICEKMLNTLDLIPIFSYVFNKWKCKHCKEKVSAIYPILELVSWALFLFIWYFLIDSSLIFSLNISEIFKLVFFLFIWFITIIYTFYDILFLEIHENILWIWVWVILFALWIQTIYSDAIFLTIWATAWLYTIMTRWLKELLDILILAFIIALLFLFKYIFNVNLSDYAILNWLIWALWIFIFFFSQIVVSWWAWMWGWDLRIALMIWLVLWTSLAFPWMMLTYFTWSIIWLSLIAFWKIKHSSKNKATHLNSQIPFWPFLAIWFFLTIFFQTEILELIKNYFY